VFPLQPKPISSECRLIYGSPNAITAYLLYYCSLSPYFSVSLPNHYVTDPSGRAEASVYGRSLTGIVSSNPTGVMDVCLL
jgi:hypothetical protein